MFPLLYNHEGISRVLKEIAKSNTKQWFFITQIVKFGTFDVYFLDISCQKLQLNAKLNALVLTISKDNYQRKRLT